MHCEDIAESSPRTGLEKGRNIVPVLCLPAAASPSTGISFCTAHSMDGLSPKRVRCFFALGWNCCCVRPNLNRPQEVKQRGRSAAEGPCRQGLLSAGGRQGACLPACGCSWRSSLVAAAQAETGVCMCACECMHECVRQSMEMLVLKEWKRSYSPETHIWLELHQSLFVLLGTSIPQRGASHPLASPQHPQPLAVPGRQCSLNQGSLLKASLLFFS